MSPHLRKVTDEQLLEAYRAAGTVKDAGRLLGINGSSVHERLVKLGVAMSKNPFWAPEELERIRREYLIYRDAGKLAQLALSMGRRKTSICREAQRMGLTDMKRGKFWFAKWKYMGEEAAAVLFEKFKASRLGLGQFCTRFELDDLGFSRTMQRHFPDEWDAVIESKAPRQTMYRLGRSFEYRVRDDLRRIKYFVLRSPRSGSPVDLVAIRPAEVLMIQCKRSGALGVKDWNELFDLAMSCGAVPIMAEMRVPRGIIYWRMVGRKDGSKRRQPMESFEVAAVERRAIEQGGLPL